MAAFARHPLTSRLVWSKSVGYPADFNYREYYRDIGFDLDQDYLEPFQYAKGVRTHTGIKYHRITSASGDKHRLYHTPTGAREHGRAPHAQDFVRRLPHPRQSVPAAGCRFHLPSCRLI